MGLGACQDGPAGGLQGQEAERGHRGGPEQEGRQDGLHPHAVGIS